jgi:glucan phosphoethanolaminetransferase (alkaline phosphatase superfamily)
MTSPNPHPHDAFDPDAAVPVGVGSGTASSPRSRRFARLRRRYGWSLAFAPAVVVVAIDALLRGDRLLELPAKYVASYSAAIVESAALWGTLVWVASARRGFARWVASAVFVVLFTVVMGAQSYFHATYSTYINLDATLFGTSFLDSVGGQLAADGAFFLRSVLPPLVAAVVAIVLGRRLVRPRERSLRIVRLAAPIVVVAAFLLPVSYRRVQASTPDVIYFHAMGGLIQELSGVRTTAQIRPGRRTVAPLPRLVQSERARGEGTASRNVVLLLTESVRADCHCSERASDCPVAPHTNLAAPDRLPLLGLRSNASATAISLAVLWTGLDPSESREALHTAPSVFELAAAAGLETAYWSSHHPMFANSRLWVQDLPTRFRCGATDLEPTADIDLGADDGLLVDRALAELPQLREPFFALVHVGNTHVPYKIDPSDAPFVPMSSSKAPEDNEGYKNYYKNAVRLQDRHLGRFVRELRAMPQGERTVVLFTSDHGEAFREHDQLGHTGSLFDEEIRVPGWIDAPAGTLSREERAHLEAHRERPTWHTDVAPTLLDLLGLLDAPELAPHRAKMPGSSWLRAPREAPMLLLTNCSGVWGCAFRNWGGALGTRKLIGREWDTAWRCFDPSTDPGERRDLGVDACGPLRERIERAFGGYPGGG